MNRLLLYPKLAAAGIRKNSLTYLPYILTCSGMIMIYYIVSFLSLNPLFGETTKMLLSMGCGVMIVFSAIFLFYTNTFLMRRRKTEFGLYNILGMGKREVAGILVFETLFIYAFSIVSGIGCGILFSKLAELLLVRMLKGTASFVFTVELISVRNCLAVFAVIFLLILIRALGQIHFSNPIELLHSENTGEKPPKANYLFAVIGMVILGAAYYIAVSIEEPLTALMAFLAAVIMVIIATYLLFIAGSVVICRLLQKNKHYYYKTNHFVSVSQMTYRMKRNGAGLASICVLSTMVLVTISSTVCLFIGENDILKVRYPFDLSIETADYGSGLTEKAGLAVNEVLAVHNAAPQNLTEYDMLEAASGFVESKAFFSREFAYAAGGTNGVDVRDLYFITADDYNRIMGTNESLSGNEVMISTTGKEYPYDTIEIEGYGTFDIVKHCKADRFNGDAMTTVVSSMFVFVSSDEVIDRINYVQLGVYGKNASDKTHYLGFDLDCDDDEQITIYNEIWDRLVEIKKSSTDEQPLYIRADSVAYEREEFMELYGGLFFLGIILGTVFICAAVLIMYYKQISEGFEDRSRFAILKKVGMTDGEIKASINSQVLTVFFMPLIAAGIHTAFAFPIISRILKLFGMTNTKLFTETSLICFGAFAVIYIAVYIMTSGSYLKIVNGKTVS